MDVIACYTECIFKKISGGQNVESFLQTLLLLSLLDVHCTSVLVWFSNHYDRALFVELFVYYIC